MKDDIPELIDSLINRLWQRKALRPLYLLLGANYRLNGLTDGWHECYDGLRDFRAACRDQLQSDEMKDTNRLINQIGIMLDRQDTIADIQSRIIEDMGNKN